METAPRRKVIERATFGASGEGEANKIAALQHDSTMLGSLFIDFNRLHRQFILFRFITREKREKQFSKKGKKLVLVEKLWATE